MCLVSKTGSATPRPKRAQRRQYWRSGGDAGAARRRRRRAGCSVFTCSAVPLCSSARPIERAARVECGPFQHWPGCYWDRIGTGWWRGPGPSLPWRLESCHLKFQWTQPKGCKDRPHEFPFPPLRGLRIVEIFSVTHCSSSCVSCWLNGASFTQTQPQPRLCWPAALASNPNPLTPREDRVR